MWLRRRALTLLLPLSALACGGKVSAIEPPDGGDDASMGRPDTTTPVVDSGVPIRDTGVTCCPMGFPSCDGPVIGGSPPCGRRGPADVKEWDVKTDGNGCPYLVPAPGGGTCLTPSPGDHGKTTGQPCTDDSTCDTVGDGINACSNALFTLGTLYPAPVCVGKECEPGTHAAPKTCDGATGLCLSTSSGGICLPRCSFDGTGAAPTGCVGADTCNAYGWSVTSSGTVTGVGFCFGGCRTTADCTKGDVCQVETGLCVKKHATPTKAPGTACTESDLAGPDVKCNCLYDNAIKKGYCANVCRVGLDTCAPGFTCDAQLPKGTFSAMPMGISGNCLLNCTSDTECAGLNARCLEGAGTGRKTCQTGIPY